MTGYVSLSGMLRSAMTHYAHVFVFLPYSIPEKTRVQTIAPKTQADCVARLTYGRFITSSHL